MSTETRAWISGMAAVAIAVTLAFGTLKVAPWFVGVPDQAVLGLLGLVIAGLTAHGVSTTALGSAITGLAGGKRASKGAPVQLKP